MNGVVQNFSTLFSGKTMEQNRKEAQDKLDKYNVKARADQLLAAQHEDMAKRLYRQKQIKIMRVQRNLKQRS